MEILDDVKAKIDYIKDKQHNKKQLDFEELAYLSKYEEFLSVLESLQIEKELNSIDINSNEIKDYLDSKKEEIKKQISDTNQNKKVSSLEKALIRIEQIKTDELPLIKYYILDNYKYDYKNSDRYIASLVKEDNYTNRVLNNTISYNGFIKYNSYTGEVIIKRDNVELAKEILSGKFDNYYLLKKIDVLPNNSPERIKTLELIDENVRNSNPNDVERIIYYARSSTGTNRENNFYTIEDTLEFISLIDDERKKDVEIREDIKKYLYKVLDNVIYRKIKEEEILAYLPLEFFPKDTSIQKFKTMLIGNNFDLNKVLSQIVMDDLISSTNFEHSKNDFINEDGSFNNENITLASEIVKGKFDNYNILKNYEKINNDELLNELDDSVKGADIKAVERIVYNGKGKIGIDESHEYDRDFYDIQILKAIADYTKYIAANN